VSVLNPLEQDLGMSLFLFPVLHDLAEMQSFVTDERNRLMVLASTATTDISIADSFAFISSC